MFLDSWWSLGNLPCKNRNFFFNIKITGVWDSAVLNVKCVDDSNAIIVSQVGSRVVAHKSKQDNKSLVVRGWPQKEDKTEHVFTWRMRLKTFYIHPSIFLTLVIFSPGSQGPAGAYPSCQWAKALTTVPPCCHWLICLSIKKRLFREFLFTASLFVQAAAIFTIAVETAAISKAHENDSAGLLLLR